MKTVTLIATEYGVDNHGLNNHTLTLDIAIENDAWSDDNILDAIKNAAKDYCLTDDGKRTYDGNCNNFNIGDLIAYVPKDILQQHGIISVEEKDTISMDFNEQLVNEDDIFPAL